MKDFSFLGMLSLRFCLLWLGFSVFDIIICVSCFHLLTVIVSDCACNSVVQC